MTRLGDVLLDIKPGFASRDDLAEGVFQFRMHNLTRRSSLDLTKRRRVGATARQLSLQSVLPGDVLFNSTNSPELVGKSALIRSLDEPAVFSNHFMRLRVDRTRLDAGYLAHYLRYQFSRGTFRSMAKAWVNQATVGRDRLEDLRLDLPPLPEQRHMAAILDRAETLHTTRLRVLSHLDTLSTSILQALSSGATWPHERLGDRLEFLTSGSRGWAKYFTEEVTGAKFIRIQNVKDGYLNDRDMVFVHAPHSAEARRTRVEPGDVLLSITADLGRTAVVPENFGEAHINQHLAILRAPSIHSRYLADYLRCSAGRQEILGKDRGATKAGLNFDDIRSVSIPVPPVGTQRNYAARVGQIDRQRSTVWRALAGDAALLASIQHRAFRGEL